MAYNGDLPPTIRRVAQNSDGPDDWVLETSSGVEIASYSVDGMSIGVWWEDLTTHVNTNADTLQNSIHDLTLLVARRDWVVRQ